MYAYINMYVKDGVTALMCAAFHGHTDIARMLVEFERGAKMDIQDERYYTDEY